MSQVSNWLNDSNSKIAVAAVTTIAFVVGYLFLKKRGPKNTNQKSNSNNSNNTTTTTTTTTTTESSSSQQSAAVSSSAVLDPNEYRKFKLIAKESITSGVPCPVTKYRFALPNSDDELGLPVGQHVYFRATVEEEGQMKEISRPYTPSSSNEDKGYFDLILKVYPLGKMSRHIDGLQIGDFAEVKGPKGRFIYKRNQYKSFGMIAGGTGLTPMLQVIREVLKYSDDTTQLSFIFANVTEQDIILKDELDSLASKHSNFKIYYTLDKPPQGWTGGVGFVTKDMIQANLPAPGEGTRILLCGPPPMIKFMKQNLSELNYADTDIFSF